MEGLFNLKVGTDEQMFVDAEELEGVKNDTSSLKDEKNDKDNPEGDKSKEKEKEKVDIESVVLDDDGNIIVDKNETDNAEEKDKSKEKEQDKGKDTSENQDGKVTPKNFSPFASAIKDAGIIPDLDVDKMTEMEAKEQAEYMLESLEKHIENKLLEDVAELGPDIHYLIKNYRKGVPLKEILDIQEYNYNVNSIKDTDIKKEDNKELRANIYREYYRVTAPNMPKNKVEKMITDAQLTGEDVEEATTYLTELKEIGKKEEVAMEKRAEARKREESVRYEKWTATVKEKIEGIDEVIPGLKLTEKEKKVIYNNMIKPVAFKDLEDGRKIPMSRAMQVREIDPDLFDIRLNALIEQGYFEKDVPKDKIIKKQKTEALRELEKELDKDRDMAFRKKKDSTESDQEQKSFIGSLNNLTKK